jgi:hypothetical protein
MWKLVLWTLAMTLLWELLTIGLRFGLQLESTRDTRPYICALTCGIRVHHAYVGGAMICVAVPVWRARWRRWRESTWVLGASLVLSDLIHHFMVLWPITGSPEFHLIYPP